MLTLDLKARLKNMHWWIGFISTIILISKYFGFDITDYISKDWQTLVCLIFGLLTLLGVTMDTSTKGVSDVINNSANENSTSNNISFHIDPINDKDIEKITNHLSQLTGEQTSSMNKTKTRSTSRKFKC